MKVIKHELTRTSSYIISLIETHLEITESSNVQVTDASSVWLTDIKFEMTISLKSFL